MRGREWKRRQFGVKIYRDEIDFAKYAQNGPHLTNVHILGQLWDWLDCFEGITILPHSLSILVRKAIFFFINLEMVAGLYINGDAFPVDCFLKETKFKLVLYNYFFERLCFYSEFIIILIKYFIFNYSVKLIFSISKLLFLTKNKMHLLVTIKLEVNLKEKYE